jgi:hypothetical protein
MLKKHKIMVTEAQLRQLFARSADVIIESFQFQTKSNDCCVLLIYCEGMADRKQIDHVVLPQLQAMLQTIPSIQTEAFETNRTLQLQPLADPTNHEKLSHFVYSGQLVLFFIDAQLLYTLNISSPPNRMPEESTSEISIKGPRDAFTESIITNTALIRKRLKTNSLCVENFVVGERSRTSVAFVYIDDVIRPEIVVEARKRLLSLKIDGLVSSAQLEDGLSENKFSLFPLLDYNGRPDQTVQGLLRGRLAILVDGSPQVLIVPGNLLLMIKSPEDMHLPFYYVTIERLIRLAGIGVAIFLPGFWIAISAFNMEQIPFPLLATIMTSRLGLPLSIPMDFFLMMALFELFRESGLRLPKAVGQTVAVVGGLFVGDAAIRAGLTGPITLVVSSISTIAMFTVTNQTLTGTITLIRLLIMLCSTILGIYGFILGLIGIVLYLSTLESFGVPYLMPLSPPNFKDMIAGVLAKPWHLMKRRPSPLQGADSTRQGGESS